MVGKNQERYTYFAVITMQQLVIRASSASAERIFGNANRLIDKWRARLHPQNIITVMVLIATTLFQREMLNAVSTRRTGRKMYTNVR
jgi:hypothetical protein